MQHMLMKATVTEATDQGTFTAVISNISVDRDGDIVEPAAVVNALHKWGPSGKKLPLAWDHQYDADFIIGHVEPMSAQEVKGEVIVDGWIDQSFDRGKHAWRLVKSGTLGFSYGFLALEASPLPSGKGFHIKAIDIFEATATPTPANADTRVLSFKSMDELRAAVEETKREAETATMPDVPADAVPPPPEPQPEPEPEPVPPPSPDEIREQILAVTKESARDVKRETPPTSPEPDPEPDPEPVPAPPVPSLEEVREQVSATMKELVRDVQREAPPVPVDAMTKAFDSFKPAGKTAEQVAGDLDGIALDGGTLFVRLLDRNEVEGVKTGEIKAVWSTAYVNNLPDSAFLYVESGEKDSEGKTTPRSKRHLPYKDADGKVDLPHLRNALARIPQSSLPQDVKDRLTRRAQDILDRSKSVDAADKEKGPNGGGSRSVDPLVREVNALATQFERDLFPRKHTTPPPAPAVYSPSPDELQRQVFEETMVHLRNEFNGDG